MARHAARFLNWFIAAGVAAAAAGAVIGAAPAEARSSAITVTCTNPASGATWQIRIDYDRATVDSYPARISDTEISWHDAADGGNYTLDRKSGALTAVVASSTGGYFRHGRCGPDPSR